MSSRKPFYLFITLLLGLGIAQIYHRHTSFEISWLPGEKRQIWSIEAKVSFDAKNEPVKATLAIPQTQPGFTRLSKNAASLGYGLSFLEPGSTINNEDIGARAIWTKREATGKQELYFRTEFLVDPKADYLNPPTAPIPQFSELEEPYQTVAEQLIKEAEQLSADPFSFTRELLKQFRQGMQSQQLQLLSSSKISQADLLVKILQQANIPARKVKGLLLEDGRRNQKLRSYLQVFNSDGESALFNPITGQQGQPDNLLIWENFDQATLELSGAKHSTVSFSIIRKEQASHIAIAPKLDQADLLNFSIDSLPLEEQALFKGILLIPIGVLIVVMLRVLVGIKTSGTFMPVLIAMAFIQTSLITGLIGFLLVVGTGLIIRSWLSRLNLLLVSRISAVIITVIGIIAIFSVISFKMGLTEGLKITFFPMIILSWTIERMSILWEEEGAKEVILQGGGSLVTAVIVFLTMNNALVRHLTFNFLGIQLLLLAIILLLGNYTGYRLLELRRFAPLVKEEQK